MLAFLRYTYVTKCLQIIKYLSVYSARFCNHNITYRMLLSAVEKKYCNYISLSLIMNISYA